MKTEKHNRFFDTFELCPWKICPQRGFTHIYNISGAQITINQIGDVVSYSPPDRFITLPGLYQYPSQPGIMYASWDNVYVHILPYILLTIRY